MHAVACESGPCCCPCCRPGTQLLAQVLLLTRWLSSSLAAWLVWLSAYMCVSTLPPSWLVAPSPSSACRTKDVGSQHTTVTSGDAAARSTVNQAAGMTVCHRWRRSDTHSNPGASGMCDVLAAPVERLQLAWLMLPCKRCCSRCRCCSCSPAKVCGGALI